MEMKVFIPDLNYIRSFTQYIAQSTCYVESSINL